MCSECAADVQRILTATGRLGGGVSMDISAGHLGKNKNKQKQKECQHKKPKCIYTRYEKTSMDYAGRDETCPKQGLLAQSPLVLVRNFFLASVLAKWTRIAF